MVKKLLLGVYALGYAVHFVAAIPTAIGLGFWDGWTYLAGQMIVAMFWPVAWLMVLLR